MKELIRETLLFIYRLEPRSLAGYAVIAALLFCILYRKCRCTSWLRPCLGIVLAGWSAMVLCSTLFSRGGGTHASNWVPMHTYRQVLAGASRELLRSAFMNVLLFFPGGLFYAGLMPENRSFPGGLFRTILLFALFSLSIELSQCFWQLGVSEFDDILHNTLGAAAGYTVFYGFTHLIKKWEYCQKK